MHNWRYGAPTDMAILNPKKDANDREKFQQQYGDLEYVSPNDKKFAEKMSANIARAEWEDWKARFKPVELELLNSVGNEQILNDTVNRSVNNVSQTFDAIKQNQAITQSRFGTTGSAQAQKSNARMTRLKEAAMKDDAANDARKTVRDRDMALLSGMGG